MDLDSLYKLAGIASFIFCGVNFVVVTVAKIFWSLTFKTLQQEVVLLKEAERKNSILRHDFTNVTNSVYTRMDKLESSLKSAIDTGFQQVKELFDKDISNINRRIDEKK